MSHSIALLALEASDGTVVITSLVLVFAMLVALSLIITLEGKLFDARKAKQSGQAPAKPKAQPRPAAPAPRAAARAAAPAPAPAADAAVPPEIVAAIAAAVASLDENLTVCGIRRIQKKPAAGSRRGVWGDAGVAQNTTPFI